MKRNRSIGRVLSPFLTPASGYSLIELLGVIAIIFALAIIAMPSYFGAATATKAGVAESNAAYLNSAIEQYDQAGGLMTAQVPMQINGSTADAELAEVQVLCRLATSENNFASGMTGPFIAPYQNPVISRDPQDYRVIWVSGVKSGDSLASVSRGASGFRNPTLENAIATGSIVAGHFEVVGPGLYAQLGVRETVPGIVTMSKNGISCGEDVVLKGPDITGVPGETIGDPSNPQPTPSKTPADPSATYSVNLTVSPVGSGTLLPANGTFPGGTVINYVLTPAKGFKLRNWAGDLVGQGVSGALFVDGNKAATAYMEPAQQTLTLFAVPITGGAVTGAGTFSSGDTATYSAIPNPGWVFAGWSGDIKKAASSGTLTMDRDYQASALFVPGSYVVVLDKGMGGTTIPEANRFELMMGDKFHVEATPDFDPAWGKDRYRWESYRVDYGEEFEEANRYKYFKDQAWDYSVDGNVTISPEFIKRFYVIADQSLADGGTIELSPPPSPEGLYDDGTVVTVTARPASSYGLRGWIAEGATESEVNSNWEASVVTKTFTVYGDTRITADFARIWTLKVTSLKPELGKVVVSTAEIPELSTGQNSVVATFIDGSTAHLRGTDIKYGYKVSKWTGSLQSTKNPTSVLMNSDKTIFADFGLRDFHLTVKSDGGGYAGITGDYKAFTTPAVVQFAHPDYQFIGWVGDTYMDKDKTILANFQQIWFYVYYGNVTADTDNHPGAAAWFTGGAGRYREGSPVTISLGWKQIYGSHKDGDSTRPKSKDSDRKSSVARVNFASQGKETNWGNTGGSATFTMPSHNVIVSAAWYCPVVVDMDGDGKISLLSGGDWKKNRPESLNKLAMRPFDLDGTGLKQWEWVGGKDGLLVWDPYQAGATPTGRELFGHDTFGQKWASGYDALGHLDKNGDGVLTDDELIGISVWIDANSNAVAEPGEIVTVKDAGITSISVRPTVLPDGNAHAPRGAILNAKSLATWDWYSRSE